MVESGLRKETQHLPAASTLPSLMKSSLELKKCEQTLKTVCKAIILKEGAKADFEKICSQRKSEMVAVHSLIRKSNNARNEIKEELNNIRTKVEKKVNYLFRIVYSSDLT